MSNSTKKKRTKKQNIALMGVILLIVLYLSTFIIAFIDPSLTGNLFQACLVATITVPFILWIYIWMYGKLTKKETMADPKFNITSEKDSTNS